MKHLLISLLLLSLLAACQKTSPPAEVKESDSLILPESFSYGGKMPELASNDDLSSVIEWNRRISNLNTDVGDLIGDSVIWHWADGNEITYSRDSLVSLVETGMTNIKSLKITIAAALPVRYNDVGDLWVYSWIFEEIENKDGSKESHYLHEDFRIVEGEVHEIYQFKRDSE